MFLADNVRREHDVLPCTEAQTAACRPPCAPGPTPGPRSQKLRPSSPVAGLTTALVVLSAHSAAHASRGSMMTAATAGAGSCAWGPAHDARANSTPPVTECVGWPTDAQQQRQPIPPSGPQQAAADAGGSWMDLPPWPLPALMAKPGATRSAHQSVATAASGEATAAGGFGRADLEDLSPLSSSSACPLGFRPTPPPSSEVCSANSQLLALRSGRSSSSSGGAGAGMCVRLGPGCKRPWGTAALESQNSGVYSSHLQHLQQGQLYAAPSLEQQVSLPPPCKVARSCPGTAHAAAGPLAFYSRHASHAYQQQQQQQQLSLYSSSVQEAAMVGCHEVGVQCAHQQLERQYLRAASGAGGGPSYRYSSSDSTSDSAGAWALATNPQQQQQAEQCEPGRASAISHQQVLFTAAHNQAQMYAASMGHHPAPAHDTYAPSSTSSSRALLAAYYRSIGTAAGAEVSSRSSSSSSSCAGDKCSLTTGQHPHQQQAPATVVLLKMPSAGHEQVLLWAGRLLSVNCPAPFELTRSMWSRVAGRLDDVLLLSLGVTGSRTQVALTVLLWLASKLEGRRRAVANASQLARPLRLLPWAVNGLELHLLQLLDWSPYSGSGCSMVTA